MQPPPTPGSRLKPEAFFFHASYTRKDVGGGSNIAKTGTCSQNVEFLCKGPYEARALQIP